MNLAPIVLFVYARPDHTKKTIESLLKNNLAKDSDVFIFSDAAKNDKVIPKVKETREYLTTVKGFKKIEIIQKNENCGLAKNIIEGVTEIINKYGKVIVLEDDIVTGIHFLEYMNDALNKYENNLKLWHITGWRDPIDNTVDNSSYVYPTMDCWGWATWKNRWCYFEKNPKNLIQIFSKEMIYRFNIDGADPLMFLQIKKNLTGEINTWAIFWYATIFLNNGLCLAPSKSLVKNIGFDNSGENCGKNTGQEIDFSLDHKINVFPEDIEVNINEFNKNKEFLYELRKRDHINLYLIYNYIPLSIRKVIKKIFR